MIYTWSVFVNGAFQGHVSSMTEYGARNEYYMKHGSASRYSGVGLDNITAKRV